MAKTLSTTEITAILESGSFDGLKGVVEDAHFECKAEPYRLEEEHQKLELAKDVSALANGHGGLILIGVQTQPDPTRSTDVVQDIRLLSDTRINISQYLAVIGAWIYPPIRDLQIRWFESSAKLKFGLVGIIVGDQDQTWRPYLLTRSIEQSGKVSTTLFGYAERGTGRSVPMSVQQIHTLLRDGYRVGTGALLPIQQAEDETAAGRVAQSLSERTEAAIKAVELSDWPVFILAAAPQQISIELPSLFSARNSDTVKLLEDPPQLRPSGFGPDAGINSRIVEGKCRRTIIPKYKLLEAWSDGTVIMIATGGADFLSWGNKAKDKLRINQLVLIECTYLFARLVKEILQKAVPTPTSTLFRLGIARMAFDKKPILFPGPLMTFPHGEQTAPGSEFVTEIRASLAENPSYTSFKLVSPVYHWFSFENDKIPYTSVDQSGQRFIDPDLIIEKNTRPI